MVAGSRPGRRAQRGHALADPGGRGHSAFGVREAGLRRAHGLAVLRERQAPRHAGDLRFRCSCSRCSFRCWSCSRIWGRRSSPPSVWCGMLFLAGYSLRLLPVFLMLGAGGLTAAYFTMPHFTSRLNRFLQGAGDSTANLGCGQRFPRRWVARARAWRGFHQDPASRCAQRFRFRRDCGGNRHCRLPFLNSDLCLDRVESIEARLPRGGCLRASRGSGPRDDLRIAGSDQHGG